jgi:hypothetical protein
MSWVASCRSDRGRIRGESGKEVQGGQLGGVAVMPGHARAGVFGVEHCVGDQFCPMWSLSRLYKIVVPSRRVRTSRAIRSFAKCWDTDGAGLPTWAARSLTDISRLTNAHNNWTRVASASIRNTSATRST